MAGKKRRESRLRKAALQAIKNKLMVGKKTGSEGREQVFLGEGAREGG